MENFSTTIVNDIIVESVMVKRATREEAKEFKIRMQKHIDDGFRKMIVDLVQCEFVDSTFLSALLVILKSLLADGRILKLVSTPQEVDSILEFTGMKKVFAVYTNKEEAIQSFK